MIGLACVRCIAAAPLHFPAALSIGRCGKRMLLRESIGLTESPTLEPENINRTEDCIDQEVEEQCCKDLIHLPLISGNNSQRERGMPHRGGDSEGGTMIRVPSAEEVAHNQATNADQ